MASTKKQTKGSLTMSGVIQLIIAIALIIIALFMLIGNASFMISGKTVDLNKVIADGGPLPTGQYVTLDCQSVLANYAETKHTTNGIPTGTDQYYVAWLDDDSFISIKIKGKTNVEKMDTVVNETWDSEYWYASSHYQAVGKLGSFGNSEIHGFYNDFFEEFCDLMEIDLSSFKSEYNIRDIELDTTSSRGSLWGMTLLFAGIGVILIITALSTFKKAKALGAAPDPTYSGVGYVPVDTSAEYNPSTPYPGNAGYSAPDSSIPPYNPVDTSTQYTGNDSYAAPDDKISFGNNSYNTDNSYGGDNSYNTDNSYNPNNNL